jgi:plasmid stability protein
LFKVCYHFDSKEVHRIMANVLIRDVSEKVLNRFKSMAESHNRSLQQELRMFLENTVAQSSPEIFQKMAEIRRKLRRKIIRFTDSAKLLREDRAR